MRDEDMFGSWPVRSTGVSPGPWTIKEHREYSRFAGRAETTWVVLDADSKSVAECDNRADAVFIADNGPTDRDGNRKPATRPVSP